MNTSNNNHTLLRFFLASLQDGQGLLELRKHLDSPETLLEIYLAFLGQKEKEKKGVDWKVLDEYRETFHVKDLFLDQVLEVLISAAEKQPLEQLAKLFKKCPSAPRAREQVLNLVTGRVYFLVQNYLDQRMTCVDKVESLQDLYNWLSGSAQLLDVLKGTIEEALAS